MPSMNGFFSQKTMFIFNLFNKNPNKKENFKCTYYPPWNISLATPEPGLRTISRAPGISDKYTVVYNFVLYKICIEKKNNKKCQRSINKLLWWNRDTGIGVKTPGIDNNHVISVFITDLLFRYNSEIVLRFERVHL